MSQVMYQVTAILDSTASVWIEDLGIEITDSTSGHDLSAWFTYDTLAGADDLRQAVADEKIIINDGVENLSSAEGVKYLTFIQGAYLEENYYSKGDLNIGGNSEVHWNNITNAPNFGASTWLEPVLYRVTDISSTPPGSPSDGDTYIDTDDDGYYIYDSTAGWQLQNIASEGDRVINLSDPTEDIYAFDSTSGAFIDLGQEQDQSCVLVDNDGDGREAQYIYNDSTSEGTGQIGWVKLADVDFGGPHRHPAENIDVENAYNNIGNDAGDDLEVVLNDINNALGNVNNQVSLDGAYDFGGAGAGRTITVDQKAVKLDATSGNYAPLELAPTSTMPTSDLQDGQLTVKGGLLYIYDATRSKWLSVQRQFLAFGKRGSTKDQYLGFFSSQLASNNSGLRMVRNATIVSLSAQIDVTGTGTFNVRKNDAVGTVTSVGITAGTGAGDTTINVDLTVGDFLQCYVAATTAIEDPMIIVEIAWRP